MYFSAKILKRKTRTVEFYKRADTYIYIYIYMHVCVCVCVCMFVSVCV